MHTILLVGLKEKLQLTRAAVLAKTRARVTLCEPHKILERMEQRPADLVVLCHTVSSEDATSLSQEIRHRWCDTRVLLVISELAYKIPADGAGFDAVVSANPPLLLRRANEMLETLPDYRVRDDNSVGDAKPS